ncbi:hypothetical protein ACJMK2_001069 [Sinanodonta woodiana]|uniref:Uncharacterized protein n=1 Tax=Sinanodonta woodiana TaxID=1069815 RepID=A0ABD3XT10_SINWO
MATANIDQNERPKCPICLDDFKTPRELPCAHTFCESCLRSYIMKEATKQPLSKEIDCPVCRQPVSPSQKHKTFQEWASLFPYNTVLQTTSSSKSKLDYICQACIHESVSITADGFCVVCKEAMCGNCIKFHKKQKLLKNHNIIPMDEISGNLQNVIKYVTRFTCSDHNEDEVQFYCRDHKIAFCGSCTFLHHKTCYKVVDLKTESSRPMQTANAGEIIEKLKNIEGHLMKFIGMNESSIRKLEANVQGFSDQIRELKKKLIADLDALEKKVKNEGKRLINEQMIVNKENNHRCLSLLHAVRNSCFNFERVNEFGTNVQKFLTAEKVASHLETYYKQVREQYERIDLTTVALTFASQVESMLSMPSSDYGKLVTYKSSKKLCMQEAHLQKIRLGYSDSFITGITSLPGNRLIMVEFYSKSCILLNASYEIVSRYSSETRYVGICATGEDEVAISTEGEDIHILSVRNDVISPVRTISARYCSTGVCDIGNGHIAITGYIDLRTCFWGLISTKGKEKCFHQFESGHGICYIAVNESNTKFYVTVPTSDALHCFDICGKNQFVYKSDDLLGPSGVAVAKGGSVFVLGMNSSNIHRLSSEGSVLDIISTIDLHPTAICCLTNTDSFIVTHYSRFEISIFRTK